MNSEGKGLGVDGDHALRFRRRVEDLVTTGRFGSPRREIRSWEIGTLAILVFARKLYRLK